MGAEEDNKTDFGVVAAVAAVDVDVVGIEIGVVDGGVIGGALSRVGKYPPPPGVGRATTRIGSGEVTGDGSYSIDCSKC